MRHNDNQMCVSISLNMNVRGYLLISLYNYRPRCLLALVIRRKFGQNLAIRYSNRGGHTRGPIKGPVWAVVVVLSGISSIDNIDYCSGQLTRARTKSFFVNAKSFNIHTVMACPKSKCVQDARRRMLWCIDCVGGINPGQSCFQRINDWEFGRSKIIGPSVVCCGVWMSFLILHVVFRALFAE